MHLNFVDLFAGIGGIRLGLQQACEAAGHTCSCVFSSEIKPAAVSVLHQNYPNERVHGDITAIASRDIPDFDILCAGFPCQAFSVAGSRRGFADTRGTLFFEVERILAAKRPRGFILENVEGLVTHDRGRTLQIILAHLKEIGYSVTYRVLNARHFGVPQDRRRIYIVGSFGGCINLDGFAVEESTLQEVLSQGLPTMQTPFTELLLSKYSASELYGKAIKDKRGGENNIHSWDIGVKGETTEEERELLNMLLTERRKKQWAEEYRIDWMDGMPLTRRMIATFYRKDNLDAMLSRLTEMGYLVREHPKRRVMVTHGQGIRTAQRVPDPALPLGYNIVAGKLSFEVSKILDPSTVAPTLVATDVGRLAVVDVAGLRRLTLREGLRLFGFPEEYRFDVPERDGFDLLGNTVVVPVVREVCKRLVAHAVASREVLDGCSAVS